MVRVVIRADGRHHLGTCSSPLTGLARSDRKRTPVARRGRKATGPGNRRPSCRVGFPPAARTAPSVVHPRRTSASRVPPGGTDYRAKHPNRGSSRPSSPGDVTSAAQADEPDDQRPCHAADAATRACARHRLAPRGSGNRTRDQGVSLARRSRPEADRSRNGLRSPGRGPAHLGRSRGWDAARHRHWPRRIQDRLRRPGGQPRIESRRCGPCRRSGGRRRRRRHRR